MESIVVTKPDMGMLPRHPLALSPFGTLAQTFAEELLARAERVEGRWPYVPLELLEEESSAAEPASAPVYQVDLRLVLEGLRREMGESERRRTVERIVERAITIRESLTASQRKEKTGEGGRKPSHTWNLNQNFYQMIRQDNRFLNGVRYLAAESGDKETPWQARALSRRLQRLREGETVLPPFSREREEGGAAVQSRRLERMSPLEEVRLLEQTAEQEHPVGRADGSLQEAARKAAERAADLLRTAAVEPAPQEERRMALTTARDIRTSGPAAAVAEQDSAKAQKVAPAPGQISSGVWAREQPGVPRPMPGLTGEELAQRMEAERGGEAAGEGQGTGISTPPRPEPGREDERRSTRKGRAREETSVPAVPEASARQAERRTALTAARDLRISGAAQKVVPVPGQTSGGVQAGEQPGVPRPMPGLAGEELAHRVEEERGGEGPVEGQAARISALSRLKLGRETEQSTTRRGQDREEGSVPAASDAFTRPTERRTAFTTVRDIRASSPAAAAEQGSSAAQKITPTPGLASGGARAGEQPGVPRPMPVPAGAELSYRMETERGGEIPVVGQAARTNAPSRPEPGREMEWGVTRRGQSRAERSVTAPSDDPARPAERRQVLTAARDIRTSGSAALAEQDFAAARKITPTPGLASGGARAGEQPGAPRPMPVPAGAELSYRMEAERTGEATGEGQAAKPGTPSRQTSGRETEQNTTRRGQGREERSVPVTSDAPARQAERRTALTAARDIRTSGPATAAAEQGSGAAQKMVPAPGQISSGEQPGALCTMPGLAGEELAHRMKEERGGEAAGEGQPAKPGTPSRQTSGRETEQSATRSGQGREEASVPAAPEAPARQAELRLALTAARDIRTSGPATAAAEQGSGAAQKVVSAPGLASDTMLAGEQPGAPRTMSVPAGEELAYRMETERGGEIPVVGQASKTNAPSRPEPSRETGRGTTHAGPALSIPGIAARTAGNGSAARGYLPSEGQGAAAQGPRWGETASGRDIRILPALRTAERTAPAAGHSALAAGAVPSGEGAELAHRAGPEPVELTYGPAAPAAESAGASKPPPAGHAAEESEYVRSLPDWARRFLRESGGQGGQSPMGTARDISALPRPAQGEETVRWTAPSYRPPAPITYREKNREAETRQAAAPRLSEGELQRAADKIYRIIEDRIRQERRRLGL